MLVAVESWVKRDHQAEWKQWVARCRYIADRVSKVPGVTAQVQEEADEGLSNRSPHVTIRWDSTKLGIAGSEVADILYNGEPRITLNGTRASARGQDAGGDTSISIVPAMMLAGEEQIVAQRVTEVLSAKHTPKPAETPAAPVGDLSGRWEIQIQYTASSAIHSLYLRQNGNRLEGTHQGNFLNRDIAGTINGDAVSLASNVAERHGDSLNYRFTGKLAGDSMSGTLDLGEYRTATWTARRSATGRG
jgi:L-seryl-tRNA(Ser) seleniumtransferase